MLRMTPITEELPEEDEDIKHRPDATEIPTLVEDEDNLLTCLMARLPTEEELQEAEVRNPFFFFLFSNFFL
jgi:hypothetical protein